jgi:hypothetical protein
MKITDGTSAIFAEIDHECALIIQDLLWLKALCLHVGAVGDTGSIRITDKKTGDTFEVCYKFKEGDK